MALLTKARLADALPEVCGKNVTVKGIDWPAARVVGNEIPPSRNSALVVAPDEIVTGEPVALSVPDKEVLDPVLTLPKFKVVGVSINCPGVLSLPDSATFNCGLEASERMERFPVIEPETLGVKTTPNVRLCPAPKLAGRDKPLGVNAALDKLACETVTLVVPVLVRTSVKVWEVPGSRLPKLRVAGVGTIRPAVAIPAPDNATLAVKVVEDAYLVVDEAYRHRWCLEVCAEALSNTDPLSVPTAGGVKVIFSCVLCPGPSVYG